MILMCGEIPTYIGQRDSLMKMEPYSKKTSLCHLEQVSGFVLILINKFTFALQCCHSIASMWKIHPIYCYILHEVLNSDKSSFT